MTQQDDHAQCSRARPIRMHSWGGQTGVNDYLMSDGAVKAMTLAEAKAAGYGMQANDEEKEWIVPHEDCLNCSCPTDQRCAGYKEVPTRSPAAVEPAQCAQVSEEERHAIEHARYQVERASPDNPDCCFDFDLVKDLLRVIDRQSPAGNADEIFAQALADICDDLGCARDNEAALMAIKHLRDQVEGARNSETIPVPKAALDWLFGEGKDSDGWGFGECRTAQLALNAKNPRRYWWRSKFRAMIPALRLSNPSTDRPAR
jgi:hypothetical protein